MELHEAMAIALVGSLEDIRVQKRDRDYVPSVDEMAAFIQASVDRNSKRKREGTAKDMLVEVITHYIRDQKRDNHYMPSMAELDGALLETVQIYAHALPRWFGLADVRRTAWERYGGAGYEYGG